MDEINVSLIFPLSTPNVSVCLRTHNAERRVSRNG